MYQVRYLTGAPDALVSCRELRGQYCKKRKEGYETNRDIKIYASFFLLKALTTSGLITNWRSQRTLIFTWLQLNERTFNRQLQEMQKKKLVTGDTDHNIHLASWQEAARILDITYTGTTIIHFNPYKHAGKQTFQYLLRAEEIEANKKLQHKALMNKLDKNPMLKNDLHLLLIRHGADDQRLIKDHLYYQERLLQLQMQLFKAGSEILSYAFAVRADINRGVKKIAEHHHYKSAQSVSYMKRRMARLDIITIKKLKVVSEARSRLYIPSEDGRRRDAYKYFKDQKQTALILTDQININYETSKQGQRQMPEKKAAA